MAIIDKYISHITPLDSPDTYKIKAYLLKNGRTFKVKLDSANASTAFDGSANITDIGVSGILGTVNGGTGNDSFTKDTLIYANTATKLASYTSTKGGTKKLWYLNAGVPTDSTETVGATDKPVYLNAGTITAGLPVWTLTNPTGFIENESFNDKTIIGNYYISAKAIADTIPDDGKPGIGSIYGTLKVSKMFTGTTNANYLRHDWFAHSSAKHFTRRTNSSAEWSGWSAYAYIPPDATIQKPAAIGGTEQPIYAKATGELTSTAYYLKSNIESGTQNRAAYYSDVRKIEDAGSIYMDDSHIGINGINISHQFYVNGSSYFNGNVSIAADYSIDKPGHSISWFQGRTYALTRITSKAGYTALTSIKTTNGSWDIGHYDSGTWVDKLLFNYITDTTYAANSSDTTNYNKKYGWVEMLKDGSMTIGETDNIRDNTAFKNTLLIANNRDQESSYATLTESKSSFGIGFKFRWQDGYAGTLAGIYGVGLSNWRAGLAFRIKKTVGTANAPGSHDQTVAWMTGDGLTIKGKTIINPSYSTLTNSFNEGLRINRGANGWAGVYMGGAVDTTSGTGLGVWAIGTHSTPADATTVAANITDSQLYISYNGSNSATSRIQGHNANGFSIRPRLTVNTDVNTSYNFYVNGTSYFNGNTTHNGIDYFANGTTYYIDNSANANLQKGTFNWLRVINNSSNNSDDAVFYIENKNSNDWAQKINLDTYNYGLKIMGTGTHLLSIGTNNLLVANENATSGSGNIKLNGTLYFANGTTYYINNSGTGNLNALTVNNTTASTTTGTGGLIVKGGAGIAGRVTASEFNATRPMIINAGKVYSNISGSNVILPAKTTMLFANGIAIANPGLTAANDVGWLRVTGTAETDTALELATGDDGGAGETIHARQYNTSNEIVNDLTLLDTLGNTQLAHGFKIYYTTIPGRAHINAAGWWKIAHATDYFNFDIYIDGSWSTGSPSITIVNITQRNGVAIITQKSGLVGDIGSEIKLGKIATNEWDVLIYIPQFATDKHLSQQNYTFVGRGELTLYKPSTRDTTSYSKEVILALKPIYGSTVTTLNRTITGATHAAALQAEFNNNNTFIPRDHLLSYCSSAYGNGSQAFGYFLHGYDSTPYGGFFVAHYKQPWYVGISSGSYTQYALATSSAAMSVNQGTANRLAYYSAAGTISQTGSDLYTDGSNLYATGGHNFITAGNEFNFIPDGFSSHLWFNYETVTRKNNGNVTAYIFGNGKHGELARITLGQFSGNAATATAFSSNATVTLTGDTTGTSTGSTKSWSVPTVTSALTAKGGRVATADSAHAAADYSKMYLRIATDSMKTNKPKFSIEGETAAVHDGHILEFHWDNGGAYNEQLALSNSKPAISVRAQPNGTWSAWTPVLTSINTKWVAWGAGTTAGPTAKLNIGGTTITSAAIPSASTGASGIVTTGAQSFAGIKTFTNPETINTTGNGAAINFKFSNAPSANAIYGQNWISLDNNGGRFYWREWGGTANGRTAGYEQYCLPACDAGRTTPVTYDIITTKNMSSLITGVKSTAADTATNKCYILGQRAAGAGTVYIATENTSGSANKTGIYFQGSTGVLMGAAWNDYAEFRQLKENKMYATTVEPGRVVYENGDDTLSISNERLMRGCSIVSDTYGFGIGESEEAQLPIAVSGRVLAYPYENKEEFKNHIGWPVCSGPNGTVSIMTEEEEMKYPSRIIGTISAVPDYEIWHGGADVIVDGRVWIKVR